MKRILVLVTACAVVLTVAASAYAAINTYTATVKGVVKGGTAAKPKPTGYTEDLSASGTGGNRTAVLLNIRTTIYGLKANTKGLPVCSAATIAAAHNDTGCPKGAKLAVGYINAAVGPANDFTNQGVPCGPSLDVWNAGGGKLTFFFVETAAHNCDKLGLKTGSTGPWTATQKQQGKNLVVDIPVPSDVSFPVQGLAGSLQVEHLVWAKSATSTKGKKVNVLESVACKAGSRPYSVAFKATLPTTNTTETKTVSSKSAC